MSCRKMSGDDADHGGDAGVFAKGPSASHSDVVRKPMDVKPSQEQLF